MDNRDEALIAQIENGHVDEVALLLLIGILSSRRLGPDTIEGIKIIDIREDDPRMVKPHARMRRCERSAFELIRASQWYRQDRWPDPPREAIALLPNEDLGFRRWVDHRLESTDIAEAIRLGHEA